MRIFIFIFVCLLMSCQKKAQMREYRGEIFGTYYIVKAIGSSGKDLSLEIKKELSRVDLIFSTYKKDSEVSRFNRSQKTSWFGASSELYELLEQSLVWSKKTKGYYDPSVGPLVNLWGFGARKSREVPDQEKIQETLSFVGYTKLELDLSRKDFRKTHKRLMLDFSSSAKGLGADQLGALLEKNGVKNYLVEIGGEILVRGKKFGKPWTLGIEAPSATDSKIQKIIKVSSGALATSGSYRNFFESGGNYYNHTINPLTGQATRHSLVSVSVWRKSCAEADILATALMSLGPLAYDFAEKHKIAAYFIQRNGLSLKSSTWKF